jgi:hypothetical protein
LRRESAFGFFSLQPGKIQIGVKRMPVNALHPTVAEEAIAIEKKYLFGV